MPISTSDPRVKRAAQALRHAVSNPFVSSNAEAIAVIVLASATEDSLDEHAAHVAALLGDSYTDSRAVTAAPTTEQAQMYLRVLPPDQHVEHYTVTGSVTRLLNDRVTEVARATLAQKYGEDSGNYVAQEVLREQQEKGLWEGVRLDSEHGQFFAYTKTEEQANELLNFLVGLSWTST